MQNIAHEKFHMIQLIRSVVYVYLCAAESVLFMKKIWIGSGSQNFPIWTPLNCCCALVKIELGLKIKLFWKLLCWVRCESYRSTRVSLENFLIVAFDAIKEGGIVKMNGFTSSDEVLCSKDAVLFHNFCGKKPNPANVHRTRKRFVDDEVCRKKVSIMFCFSLFIAV